MTFKKLNIQNDVTHFKTALLFTYYLKHIYWLNEIRNISKPQSREYFYQNQIDLKSCVH